MKEATSAMNMCLSLRLVFEGHNLTGTHLLRLVSITCPLGHWHPRLHTFCTHTLPRLSQVFLLHELAQVEYTWPITEQLSVGSNQSLKVNYHIKFVYKLY